MLDNIGEVQHHSYRDNTFVFDFLPLCLITTAPGLQSYNKSTLTNLASGEREQLKCEKVT